MSDDIERDPLVRELRESLSRRAAEAPRGDLLAERIISAADQQSAAARDGRRRRWRAWALPAIAAAAVGGVVLAVVGIETLGPQSSQPAASPPGASQSLPPPQSTVQAPTTSTAPSTSPRPSSSNVVELTGVRLIDLTFVSEDSGWALASADCLSGPGRCTALLRTTDGTNWRSMPGAQFNVPGVSAGCDTKCVTNIRFANQDVGYAYGPEAFFVTRNGGAGWQQEPGGAIQLETLDGNVIRVTASHSGCPSWCDVQVETSEIGSSTWKPARLGPTQGYGVQLSRGGSNAYLLFPGHPAGGGPIATSVLYRSTDDGRTWDNMGEPCPQTAGEVDSYALAAGGGDRMSVLCADRQAPQRWFVATSDDSGATFTARPGTVPVAAAALLAGDPDTVLVAGDTSIARSTDGGRTWDTVANVDAGHVMFLGFESASVGRAIVDEQEIWTTRDGGRTWTPARFG